MTTIDEKEAPEGFIAVLKADAHKYGRSGDRADVNFCEFCDWRKQCQDPSVTKAIPKHRCMPGTVVLHDTKEEVSRSDGCSVLFIATTSPYLNSYCVTALFVTEPDANHTKWFPSKKDAQAYLASLGEDANAAIGQRLSLSEAKTMMEKGKEVCFIFDDGTESVYEGGDIDPIYADLPLAMYI